ncbi:DUF6891 domain-containing protein [Streptomyces xiamenensis]|uniref:DUF6891 domain-containing protein n=1 Tax=Streptomyces xiamenensis TaxID=408015 RepID=UPI0037D27D56
MLGIRVRTEDGRLRERLTAGELGALVRRIGGAGDRFVVVERLSEVPDVYAQVWHEEGGAYSLEHRDGDPERHFTTTVDTPGPVAEALTGWARSAEGWDAGVVWERLTFPQEVTDGGGAEETEQTEQTEDAKHAQAPPLTRAFAELEAAGITARENFACCRACGLAEIGGAGAPDARGFVFLTSEPYRDASLLYGGFDGSAQTTAAIGREVVAGLERWGLDVVWDGEPGSAITVRTPAANGAPGGA